MSAYALRRSQVTLGGTHQMAGPDAVLRAGDRTAVVRKLGPGFASRAAGYDANDSFVTENFLELKEHKMFSDRRASRARWWWRIPRGALRLAA